MVSRALTTVEALVTAALLAAVLVAAAGVIAAATTAMSHGEGHAVAAELHDELLEQLRVLPYEQLALDADDPETPTSHDDGAVVVAPGGLPPLREVEVDRGTYTQRLHVIDADGARELISTVQWRGAGGTRSSEVRTQREPDDQDDRTATLTEIDFDPDPPPHHDSGETAEPVQVTARYTGEVTSVRVEGVNLTPDATLTEWTGQLPAGSVNTHDDVEVRTSHDEVTTVTRHRWRDDTLDASAATDGGETRVFADQLPTRADQWRVDAEDHDAIGPAGEHELTLPTDVPSVDVTALADGTELETVSVETAPIVEVLDAYATPATWCIADDDLTHDATVRIEVRGDVDDPVDVSYHSWSTNNDSLHPDLAHTDAAEYVTSTNAGYLYEVTFSPGDRKWRAGTTVTLTAIVTGPTGQTSHQDVDVSLVAC